MTRLRRLALTIVVGVLITLPTAGSALANTEQSNDTNAPTSDVLMTATLT